MFDMVKRELMACIYEDFSTPFGIMKFALGK